MKYPDEHWERVAKRYTLEMKRIHPTDLVGGKTMETVAVARTQDHFPHVTKGTVAAWVRKCREKGLL